jgi:general secretion pathway protein C
MKALFTGINLLLLAAAAWLAAGIFYQSTTGDLAHQAAGPASGPSDVAQQSPPARPFSAYTAIERRNLFNTNDGKAGADIDKALQIDQLAETKLDLKLWGTVTLSKDPQGDYAVIEDRKQRRQQLYRVGDSVQNAVVKAILRQKIVLSVNGKDEVLTMEEAQANRPATPPRLASAAASPRPVSAKPVESEMVLDRKTVTSAMDDLGSLMSQVRVRPHFENGRPAGLALISVKPNSIFQKMGIRNGDVLQQVEGNDIRSVDDVVKLYQQLGSGGSVTLQIKRRGRLQDVTYRIQ